MVEGEDGDDDDAVGGEVQTTFRSPDVSRKQSFLAGVAGKYYVIIMIRCYWLVFITGHFL